MPARLRLAGFTLLALLTSNPARAQAVPLDSLARSFAEANGLPSLVVGVSVDGARTVVGVGEVRGAAPDARTLYEIGSVSKVLTSLALADAVARGEVTLETPVAELLPGWTLGAHADGPVRLVDLATHTSGLPRLPLNAFAGANMQDPYAVYSPDLLRAALAGTTPTTAPGEAYAYSNLGAGLLGFALAQRAETTYGEFVTEHVLAPLGLDETMLTVAPADTARFALAHGADGAPVPHWTFQDPTAGAGAWRSTVDDLLRFAEAALVPEASPLADALILAQTPRAPAGGGQIGLGWHLNETAGQTVQWHNGMVGGSASFVGIVPGTGVAVVVLTNRQASVDALAIEVLARLAAAR